jgi:hypothetical protein
MPRDKRDPAARKPPPYEGAGSAAINATVARVAPAILGLLADGVPRSRPAIVEALAGRHDKQDCRATIILAGWRQPSWPVGRPAGRTGRPEA